MLSSGMNLRVWVTRLFLRGLCKSLIPKKMKKIRSLRVLIFWYACAKKQRDSTGSVVALNRYELEVGTPFRFWKVSLMSGENLGRFMKFSFKLHQLPCLQCRVPDIRLRFSRKLQIYNVGFLVSKSTISFKKHTPWSCKHRIISDVFGQVSRNEYPSYSDSYIQS